jgi:hypothetical protein
MKAAGSITKWKEMDCSNGRMVEDTKVITWTIKNMVSVFLHGPMAESTKVTG